MITHFKLPQCFPFAMTIPFQFSLQRVAMAYVTGTSEEHTACIFKVEVSYVFPYPQKRNVRCTVRSEPLYG
jgi:hypothetical protein